MFDKVTIMKPNVSNVFSNKKYVICKNYLRKGKSPIEYNDFLESVKNVKDQPVIINSIITNSLSYYFLNKIEEINIMIGQQKLEFCDQIISLIKNKNKEEKIETIKYVNIQKCIYWCEKYKIPFNKFPERSIFNATYEIKNECLNEIIPKEINDSEISNFVINYVLNNFDCENNDIIPDEPID